MANELHNKKSRYFNDIKVSADRADAAAQAISDWLWRHVVGEDVLPREMPEPLRLHLAEIAEALGAIRRLADSAHDYFSPIALTLLDGRLLSPEEYFLYRASGAHFGTAVQLGLSSFDDYYVYRMLCYKDDECQGFINTLGSGLGLRPEQCKRSHLRSEQRIFFQKHLPDVYARFSDN